MKFTWAPGVATDNNFWLSYRELADQLVPYAKWMGFTHLELLPINEHPSMAVGVISQPACMHRPAVLVLATTSVISLMPHTQLV